VSDGSTISTMKNPIVQPSRRDTPSTSSALIANNYKVHCVYCNGEHFSAACSAVINVRDRKDILLKAKRFFHCLRTKHKSKECDGQKTCRYCHCRHHQSICEWAPPAMNTGSDGTDVPQPDKSTIDTSTKSVTSTTNSNKARGLYSCKLHELLLLEMPRECQLEYYWMVVANYLTSPSHCRNV